MALLFSPDSAFSCIVPPKPVNQALYWCGKTFLLEPLLELYTPTESYGVVILTGTSCHLERVEFNPVTGKLTQKHILHKFEVLRDKRQKKGGQSAHRFQMNRLGQIAAFEKAIVEEHAKHVTWPTIIIGAKDIAHQLKLKDSIAWLPDDSKLNETITLHAKRADAARVEPFIIRMLRGDARVIYGLTEIKEALADKVVETLVIHADVESIFDSSLRSESQLKAGVHKIVTRADNLKRYGGAIAVTYYARNIGE